MATTTRHTDVIEASGSTISDAASAVREAALEKIERGKDKVRDVRRSIGSRVQEQPIKSVLLALGIGAGVGVLVAYMLRRR
jgi:ElaB/YqjD/DUF883 family membrane-anchored ribosome-binding protein